MTRWRAGATWRDATTSIYLSVKIEARAALAGSPQRSQQACQSPQLEIMKNARQKIKSLGEKVSNDFAMLQIEKNALFIKKALIITGINKQIITYIKVTINLINNVKINIKQMVI